MKSAGFFPCVVCRYGFPGNVIPIRTQAGILRWARNNFGDRTLVAGASPHRNLLPDFTTLFKHEMAKDPGFWMKTP
jgi:hypothetical protein